MSAAETSGAFIDASLRIEGASEGLLKGLTFAVKDMYDVSRKAKRAWIWNTSPDK